MDLPAGQRVSGGVPCGSRWAKSFGNKKPRTKIERLVRGEALNYA